MRISGCTAFFSTWSERKFAAPRRPRPSRYTQMRITINRVPGVHEMFEIFKSNPAVALLKEDHERSSNYSASSKKQKAGRQRKR
jgi:hypothetical protein